ncbi:hypothetical protein K458DRAFT_416520 [Lentithecium fluviatile CBS 122367]|uniref:SMP domain-containing protein n=1 Tax=Lentithecium fluviatile CBS 122367 TaxID=1168545 RepID=A0A6G1J6S6_9PLEO|nr:hypothetical protein K458DRAFT_416520 [Lentithecium fluviatile CBS 122367]
MSTRFLRFTRLATATPLHRTFVTTTARALPAVVDAHFISQITAAEKTLTLQTDPVQGGPTARAQSHAGQPLTAQIIHDITMGERSITGQEGPVQNGPTAVAQHFLSQSAGGNMVADPSTTTGGNTGAGPASGVLDSATISKITEKEKRITGSEEPVKSGPTARAQQHAGEPISSQALHDITEGEKKVTDGKRVKGGPTAKAQSELTRSRS